MAHVSKNTETASEKHASDIEKCLDGCKKKFNQIVFVSYSNSVVD